MQAYRPPNATPLSNFHDLYKIVIWLTSLNARSTLPSKIRLPICAMRSCSKWGFLLHLFRTSQGEWPYITLRYWELLSRNLYFFGHFIYTRFKIRLFTICNNTSHSIRTIKFHEWERYTADAITIQLSNQCMVVYAIERLREVNKNTQRPKPLIEWIEYKFFLFM